MAWYQRARCRRLSRAFPLLGAAPRLSKRRSDLASERRLGTRPLHGVPIQQLKRRITLRTDLASVEHHNHTRIPVANPPGDVHSLTEWQMADDRVRSIEEWAPALPDQHALAAGMALAPPA